jgi:hypothetical protein
MTRLLIVCGLAAASLAGVAARQGRDEPERPTVAAREPFEVDRCYRVFPQNRDQFYLFRVVAAPSGPWVAVRTEPAPTRVPGGRPPAPLWLNANGLFAVQEWGCAE